MATTPPVIITENPLKSFFRKSKFRLTLPSSGKWYPTDSLNLNPDGSIDIYAMNASDDIRFKSGELSLNGKSITSLIKSCVPNIINPENIPSIDIDTILIAIRSATYGDKLTVNVSVPNTTLVRTIDVSISSLLNKLPSDSSKWDDKLIIKNEEGLSLILKLIPLTLGSLFKTTKTMAHQKYVLSNIIGTSDQSELSDEQMQKFDDSVIQVTQTAIDLICESIQNITLTDDSGNILANLDKKDPSGILQIKQLVNKLDVNYFNAIRNHLDAQRKNYAFKTDIISSTPSEVEAGAPDSWDSEISFTGSDFFGK